MLNPDVLEKLLGAHGGVWLRQVKKGKKNVLNTFFFFFSWMYPPVFLPLGQDFVGNLNKFTSCRTRFQGLHKHGPYKGKLGEELGQMSVPLNPHTRQQCWENLLPKAGAWIEK